MVSTRLQSIWLHSITEVSSLSFPSYKPARVGALCRCLSELTDDPEQTWENGWLTPWDPYAATVNNAVLLCRSTANTLEVKQPWLPACEAWEHRKDTHWAWTPWCRPACRRWCSAARTGRRRGRRSCARSPPPSCTSTLHRHRIYTTAEEVAHKGDFTRKNMLLNEKLILFLPWLSALWSN